MHRPRAMRLPGGQTLGIIASTTQPFCGDCDRARLTADGQLLTCLYATAGVDLRGPLRDGASDADLAGLILAHLEPSRGPRRRGASRRRASRRVHPARRIAGRASPRNAHARRLTSLPPAHPLVAARRNVPTVRRIVRGSAQ